MSRANAMVRALFPTFHFERLGAVRQGRLQLQRVKREELLEAAARYIERMGLIVRHRPFA